jgi:hypothetical protein
MRKLTIVVTCTGRKTVPPTRQLQARHLPLGSLADRADTWRHRLCSAVDNRPLRRLYQGEAWTQVEALERAAWAVGYEPRVLVTSAGLGLRAVDSCGPPYAATFSPGHADSVGRHRGEAQQWWRHLRAAPEALDPDTELRGRVLLVLSAAYAAALAQDLHQLASRGDDALVVGGADDVGGLPRVAADKSLRQQLGGTATSLNLRTAQAWLERTGNGGVLYSRSDRAAWDGWVATVRRVERWDRRRISDEEVLSFIRQATGKDPELSRTRALRHLRDSGWACEQRRFAVLFEQAGTMR